MPFTSYWRGEMGSSSVPSLEKLASSAAYLGWWGAPQGKRSQNAPQQLLVWGNGELFSAIPLETRLVSCLFELVGSSSGQALPKHPSPAAGVGKWGALQCHPLRNAPRQLSI